MLARSKRDRVILICGPTACGKTYFGHLMARKLRGQIICGDSRQLYSSLPIITASPSIQLTSQLPYILYNLFELEEEFSAPKYANLAAEAIYAVLARGRLPIVVGGSGMYLSALIYGYQELPQMNPDIKKEALEELSRLGNDKFFQQLTKLDPLTISKFNPGDTQRITRAYCIFRQTGTSIITLWKECKRVFPLGDMDKYIFLLAPERSFLHSTCNIRTEKIFIEGAIEEIKQHYSKIKSLRNPATTAVGVEEIIDYLDGLSSFNKALELTKARTRQYAKRQITWFKHQIRAQFILNYSTLEELDHASNLYCKKISEEIGFA